MATAWITRVVNATDHELTIMQDDASWRPVVAGKQYAKDEPIRIRPQIRKGQPWQPFPFMPTYTVPAPNDIITDFPMKYCIVPWQGYGRLRLVGPSGRWVEFQVGRFVGPGEDRLRGVLSNGETPLLVELGDTGGGWWSISYDFEIYVQQDQGVRWNIQSTSTGMGPVVAAVGALLREIGPLLLKFLLA